MFHVIICEDDHDYIQILEDRVKHCLRNKDLDFFVECYHSLSALEERLKSGKIDILFLDLVFGEHNSVEWAKIHLADLKISLIFVTGFPQEAYNISEVEHSYYIIKSKCTQTTVDNALTKAISETTKRTPRLTVVKVGEENRVIDRHNVVYIESMNNQILLHMQDGEIIPVYATLSKCTEHMPVNFLQCHKSFIINMDHILSFKPCCFIMSNGNPIVIPAKKYKTVTQKYEAYLKNFAG